MAGSSGSAIGPGGAGHDELEERLHPEQPLVDRLAGLAGPAGQPLQSVLPGGEEHLSRERIEQERPFDQAVGSAPGPHMGLLELGSGLGPIGVGGDLPVVAHPLEVLERAGAGGLDERVLISFINRHL